MSLKINVSLKTNDKMWRSMVRNLTKGGDKTSVVGWWNSIHPTGVPVAQVAQWNEEGHENGKGSMFPGTITPSRPFMTKGFLPQVQEVLPKFVSKAHQV